MITNGFMSDFEQRGWEGRSLTLSGWMEWMELVSLDGWVCSV